MVVHALPLGADLRQHPCRPVLLAAGLHARLDERGHLLHEPDRNLRLVSDRARVRRHRGHDGHGDLCAHPEGLLLDRAGRACCRLRPPAFRQPERFPGRLQPRGDEPLRRSGQRLSGHDRRREQVIRRLELRHGRIRSAAPASALACLLSSLAQLGRNALRRGPRSQGHPQAVLEHVLGAVGHSGPRRGGGAPHQQDDRLELLSVRQRGLLEQPVCGPGRRLLIIVMGLWFFGWAGTLFLSSTRVIFAAAFDRVLPAWAANISAKRRVPYGSLVLMILPSLVISAVYAYKPTFTSVFLDATAVLALTFFATVVAAIILPWRRKDLYEASPIARYKVAGVPAITIVGVITGLFLLFMLYEWSFNKDNLYGTSFQSTPNSVYYFLATYIVAIIIYVAARIVRSRQGIDLRRIHHEIPVE
ncbi:MAG: APC family permease [Chloroflexi bacterium]|nr:MAG: APC family permease [Chloroflexota bacterium]